MIAYLIEHYAGAFPVWLSPIQIAVVPISEKQFAYAQEVHSSLIKNNIRANLNLDNETMNYKVRRAVLQKVPYIIILGDKEVSSCTISIRDRMNDQRHGLLLDDFIGSVARVIQSKSLNLWD